MLFIVGFTKVFTAIAMIISHFLAKDVSAYEVNFILFILIYMYIELVVFMALQFVLSMWAVKTRYQKINLYLHDNVLTSINENVNEGDEKLNKAALLHD